MAYGKSISASSCLGGGISGRALRALLLLLLVIGLAPMLLSQEAHASAANVENPRVSDGVTTWDCVWFGSYPQTEVKATDALANADWDSDDDATVNGVKYHRLKKEDATHEGTGSSGYYDWTDKDVAYFRYEPIKWRVLEVDGSKALLVSDVGLDDQEYNLGLADVTWATCTMRSWLNGYGSSDNAYGADYSGKGFLQKAFSSSEREAIVQTTLKNEDNSAYGTEGGDDTEDKVFLLAESDVCSTDAAATHGFSKFYDYDKARRCKTSEYAKAMGAWKSTETDYAGNCHWWLRSPGVAEHCAAYVDYDGFVKDSGFGVDIDDCAVRPASWVDLNSSSLTYAGTVSSDGAVHEEGLVQVDVSATGGGSAWGGGKVRKGSEVQLGCSADEGYVLDGWYSGGELLGTEAEMTVKADADMEIEAKFDKNHKDLRYADVTLSYTATAEVENVSTDAVTKYPATTYSGKKKTPTVTVKSADGAVLKKDRDYTLKYSSSTRKYVGLYTVTVTGKGKYGGTAKVKFAIKPGTTSIYSRTAYKGGLKMKWKKKTAQRTGYQFAYGKDKKFPAGSYKSYRTTSCSKTYYKKSSGLDRKTYYYGKVRCYKKTSSGLRIYSSWSSCKSVKTK